MADPLAQPDTWVVVWQLGETAARIVGREKINEREEGMAILTAKSNEVIPTREYLCSVMSIEPDEGQFGEQFKWTLAVVSPKQYAGHELCAWCSTSTSVKSKLVKWGSAALGRQIESGESFDTDNFVGKNIVVAIIAREKDDGTEYNKVETMKAYKPTRVVAEPVLTPAPREETPPPPSDDDDEFGGVTTDPFADIVMPAAGDSDVGNGP